MSDPNHRFNESNADKFGDRPALLSENPTSNEANGGVMNTTTIAPAATYVHETLNFEGYVAHLKTLPGPSIDPDTFYSRIEYMNSPHGVVILAHRDYDEVVEGIHPATISHSIEVPRNIVEPLAGDDAMLFARKPVAYNSHCLTRRSQGGLVLAAFGRMIDGGDPEAPCIHADEDTTLQMSVHETPDGPLFFVFSSHVDGSEDIIRAIRPATHIIRPASQEAA